MGPREVIPRGRFELEDVDAGSTRVRYQLDPEPVGGEGGKAKMMMRKIRKDAEKDLESLKQLLEGG